MEDRPSWAGSSPHTRGTLYNLSGMMYSMWDHPRIRGEHYRRHRRRARRFRIIPAYAGNTGTNDVYVPVYSGSSPHTRGTPRFPAGGVFSSRDHPRIRGEHGSDERFDVAGHGIIPAYAGNTADWLSSLYAAMGSSPHTRGTQLMTCAQFASKCILASLPSRCLRTVTHIAAPYGRGLPYSNPSSGRQTASHRPCPRASPSASSHRNPSESIPSDAP